MIQKLPHVTKFAEEREKISNECIELASEFFSPYLVCLLKIGVWYFMKMIQIDDSIYYMYNVAKNCIYYKFICSMHLKCFQHAD